MRSASPYLTLIVTLDDPLMIAAHPDHRQSPGRYESLLGGLHTTPALITHEGSQSGIQVALSPLGARALLGLPAGELAGIDVHAGEVLGRFVSELQDRLRLASGWPDRFATLDRMLQERMDPEQGPPSAVSQAWRTLLTEVDPVTVPDLARASGWSSRHFRERFSREVGLTPNAAARVVRFDRARRRLQNRAARGEVRSLADLAVACGYFDQAHLAREFRDFAGCPPSQWLAEEFRNVQVPSPDPVPELAP